MSNQISSVLPKYYIYKLYFKSGKTYIGQHTQKKEKDNYITSSSYYRKHLEDDPLIKREIILEVRDKETLSIMETICILADKAERGKENVNGNKGDWIYWTQSIEWTDERRRKLSDSQKEYYKTHSGTFLGKKHTERTIQKIRERNLGKKMSEEIKRKMSEKRKGIPLGPMTESHKKKVGEASHTSFLNSEKKRNALNHKGHKHWTNGKENKFQLGCPGEGWYEGFSANTESHSKKIKVLETNQVFRTQRECAIALGVSSPTIREAIKRNRSIVGKYHVKLV